MDDVNSLAAEFVPDDFVVPRTLHSSDFVLEPLGPEHNDGDHPAWSGSIDHIHATPGFTAALWQGDDWPYPMSSEQNLTDLQMHAREFAAREAFAYTVLGSDRTDAGEAEVIGCVYIDPDTSGSADALLGACRSCSPRPTIGRHGAPLAAHRLAVRLGQVPRTRRLIGVSARRRRVARTRGRARAVARRAPPSGTAPAQHRWVRG
jgi:hypothetical protein